VVYVQTARHSTLPSSRLQWEAEKEAAPDLYFIVHIGLGTCIFKGLTNLAGRVNGGTPSAQPRFYPSSRDVAKRGSQLPSVLHALPQPCSGSSVEHCHIL